MTAPGASFLDFFVLEASEYVEQIDGLILRATDAGPDAEGLQRVARALRGSATMAKLGAFAELASGVEGVGRARRAGWRRGPRPGARPPLLRGGGGRGPGAGAGGGGPPLRAGSIKWHAGLKGVLVSAVEDLKILVRAARSWSANEDQRAMSRVAELAQFAQLPAGAPTPIAATSSTYYAGETSNIAAGLELLATRPDDRVGGTNVLARVRALRGVAGVKDVPALAEVSEAAESAVRPLEMGEARLAPENVNLLRAAADLLRTIAAGLVSGQTVTTSTPQYKAFLTSLDGLVAHKGADRVVPIADLFYDDAGPHIVSVAPHPPTTPAQRFRMEVVSLGEHLHRVIDESRRATDAIQQEHSRGELGRALRAIRATASSFGQMAVAQTVDAHLERTGDLNEAALDAISQFAATISPAPQTPPPAASGSVPIRPTHIGQVAAALGSPGPLPRTSAAIPNPGPVTPRPMPSPAAAAHAPSQVANARVMAAVHAPTSAPASASPSAAASAAMSAGSSAAGRSGLDAHIAAFEALSNERMAEPANVQDDVVPVDALLYRGRAALDRAVELRDAIRRAGGTPAPEMLEELYDLVELARVP